MGGRKKAEVRLPLIRKGKLLPRETRTATLREQVAAGTLYLANESRRVPPSGVRDDVSEPQAWSIGVA